MKTTKKNIALSIFWVVLGLGLIICAIRNVVDSYWIGMGGGFLGVGVGQIARLIRYKTDAQYREQVDISSSDERNKFLASKAWAAAGNMFIIFSGIAVIVLRILGYNQYSLWAAYNVCTLLVIYLLSYLWASKKY